MSAAHDVDVLALELVEAADRPARVLAIAARLAALARHLHQQENMAVPPHLRVSGPLPVGVTRLCGWRARP
ncbi:hypothetical protein E2C06_34080 [Dankookia rubra]|uniref:Uncharacterized protein n=1 Tax=Dankookia rubra TaxID=1442381 RepID=A0A4V3A980_9PROT|nr:hypothetical protein [Dankookia rubra]TDH58165.1 hypothetical protein E2C06_34080 [Dankookia rubra]